MEYMEYGDLQRYIRSIRTSPESDVNDDSILLVSESEVKTITAQLLEGLKVMHHLGYIHRDLKPAVSIRDSDFIIRF